MSINNSSEYMDFNMPNSLMNQMRLSMCLSQRKVILNDNVSDDTIFECVYYLHKLIDIDKKCGCKKPIEIYVNTNGGSVYDGFSLISLIEQMKDDGYEIITINTGKAFSMGFWIALCGSVRKAYRYSSYMYHDIACGIYGKGQEIKETVEELDRLSLMGRDILKKYINITDEEYDDIILRKVDKFFSPEDILNKKGIEEIL